MGYEPVFIILAAGSNSRFWPLHGKSLLRFCGTTLIERQIDLLAAVGIREGVVVANEATAAETRAVTARYQDRVQVVVPDATRGMGDALVVGVKALGERVTGRPLLVTQSHDVVDKSLYERVIAAGEGGYGAIAGQEVSDYFPGGYLELDGERIRRVVEKPPPGSEPSRYVNLVIHLHPQPERLVAAVEAVYEKGLTNDDHYEQALSHLCDDYEYRLVPYDGPWHPIKYPWHVLSVMRYFLDRMTPPPGPQPMAVRGNVVLEPGVTLMPGAFIQGPAYIGAGTVVGNNTLIRGSIIGRNCDVGFNCEVARTYSGDNCTFHHNYVGDSVLEDEVALGFGTVTGNAPFYAGPVHSRVSGERLSTGMDKFGAVIGRGARTGIGVLLNPGVKVGRRSYVGPGVVVARDVPEGRLLLVRQQLDDRENPFVPS